MRVRWKKILTHNINGEPVLMCPLGPGEPVVEDEMLEKIQTMEGIPIPFEIAVSLFLEDMIEAFESETVMSSDIQRIGLARWIGSKGYRIILTGKEYELIP